MECELLLSDELTPPAMSVHQIRETLKKVNWDIIQSGKQKLAKALLR